MARRSLAKTHKGGRKSAVVSKKGVRKTVYAKSKTSKTKRRGGKVGRRSRRIKRRSRRNRRKSGGLFERARRGLGKSLTVMKDMLPSIRSPRTDTVQYVPQGSPPHNNPDGEYNGGPVRPRTLGPTNQP